MDKNMKQQIINIIIESLDIPDSSYQSAEERYHDISEWLNDKSKSKSALYAPHIFPQGSFRLGTAIKPWKREDYDLDLVCNLEHGITKTDCTQRDLKNLIGQDLNMYRENRKIQAPLEEKHRCWRLSYQDHMSFHMDTVPSIPQAEDMRRILEERMVEAGTARFLAKDVAELAIAITDDRHENYDRISEKWYVSNPDGYAKWFESRMKQAQKLLESRVLTERVAKIDELPAYRWKTPLQRCIQLLKRHRDIMFERNIDAKPISIIITTLAARAYQGETDLDIAIENILDKMLDLIYPREPRVPNPVNPVEDFADRWKTPEGRKLQLEENFYLWVSQAKADFINITTSQNKEFIAEKATQKYGIKLLNATLNEILSTAPIIMTSSKSQKIHNDAPKPWQF